MCCLRYAGYWKRSFVCLECSKPQFGIVFVTSGIRPFRRPTCGEILRFLVGVLWFLPGIPPCRTCTENRFSEEARPDPRVWGENHLYSKEPSNRWLLALRAPVERFEFCRVCTGSQGPEGGAVGPGPSDSSADPPDWSSAQVN